MNTRTTSGTNQTPMQFWQVEAEAAQEKARNARGKATIRKWNTRAANCRSMICQLERDDRK